jgi:hypothetical protein
MSDETPTAISPPTNDDNLAYDFQIQIKIDPFLCVPDGEPESGMTRLSGDIWEMDEDCNPDEVVGHVEFCLADFRDQAPSWVLDGRIIDARFINLFGDSQMIHGIQDVPDDEVRELSAAATKALGGIGCTDEVPLRILIFHRLEILPRARRRKLGHAVLKRIMEKFGVGCDFAALKSYPLQHEAKGDDTPRKFDKQMALDALEANEAKAKKSLAKYYKGAGFRPVAGTDGLMVKNLVA